MLRLFISQSHLSVADRLTIGQILNDAGDEQTAEVWYKAGLNRLYSDYLSAADVGKQSVLDLFNRSRPAFDAAAPIFWKSRDGDAHLKLTEMELRLPREAANDQRVNWARIGHSEALYLLGRREEARNELDRIKHDVHQGRTVLTEGQKVEMCWATALLDYAAGNFELASSALKDLARDRGFKHRIEASQMLVVAAAMSGDPAGARQHLDEWIVACHPPASEVAKLMAVFEPLPK
jgi:hypothetical protein